jgi:TM2 domain-containing membrane protein YozV/RNA polymerase subunit RPABC4/transcription elongation factor Spt4
MSEWRDFMFCKHCGKKIDEDSAFCNFCGKSTSSQTVKQDNNSQSVATNADSARINKNAEIENILIANKSYISTESIDYLRQEMKNMSADDIHRLKFLRFIDPVSTTLFAVFLFPLGLDRFFLGNIGLGIIRIIVVMLALFFPIIFIPLIIWYIYEAVTASKRTHNYNARLIIDKKIYNGEYISPGINRVGDNTPKRIMALISAIVCGILFFVNWFEFPIIGKISFFSFMTDFSGIVAVLAEFFDSSDLLVFESVLIGVIIFAGICVLLFAIYIIQILYYLCAERKSKSPSAYYASVMSAIFTSSTLVFVWLINYIIREGIGSGFDYFGAGDFYDSFSSNINLIGTTPAVWIILILSIIMFCLQYYINGTAEPANIQDNNKKINTASQFTTKVKISDYNSYGFSQVAQGNFAAAEAIFNEVLQKDPHYAMAWWGLLMVKLQCRGSAEMKKLGIDISNRREYINAVKYADDNLMIQFESIKDAAMI